jgi:hypothetical protein
MDPDLHIRAIEKRNISKGERPWTNFDGGNEEQSSLAHVAGILVTHTPQHQCVGGALASAGAMSVLMGGSTNWKYHVAGPKCG